MEVASASSAKGKQRAQDPRDTAQPAADHTPASNDAGSSRPPEPMAIPSRTTQDAHSVFWRTPSSSHGHDRRPSHARAKSSVGSASMFDFFGPSSLASNSTTATSFCLGSPDSSPKAAAVKRVIESEDCECGHRSSLESTIEAGSTVSAFGEQATLQHASQTQRGPSSGSSEGIEAARSGLGLPSAPMPPLYPEETLPSYEEAPEYTPPLSQPTGSSAGSKTSAFRAAAASRFLSSRIAKKLNLPPALQSRLQGTQTPNAVAGFGGAARATFVRSDSAPNLAQQGRRRIEVRDYAATAYMEGARMGPAPRRPRTSSSRPATAGAESVRSQSSARTSTPRSTSGINNQRSVGASPLQQTAASSASSSRRNSGESRPPSRATINSAPNGGLFHCGYTRSQSGASTPTRVGLLRKGRSRHASLRSLGDLLTLNRERGRTRSDDSSEGGQPATDESVSANATVREVVSPVSGELLISARVHTPASARPVLMNAARSSPQASIDAAASGSPILILPDRANERRPDPLQKLPRETILKIFQSLIDLHVEEHATVVKDGLWRGKRSSETRWIGTHAALRELAHLSRVSRSWQSYVLDGQLWQSLQFSQHPDMTEAAMVNIARSVGPFVRRLDLHGLAGLSSNVLLALSKAQRPRMLTSGEHGACTSRQLEELDLRGCRNISTLALNKVLSQSPNLRNCKLSGLPCVDNTTLCVLAARATKLETLDISRCRSVDADGIRAVFAIQLSELDTSAVVKERNVRSPFRELCAAGVPGFDRTTLAQLGRHWPNLEVLDLSYCSEVNDAAIAALVSSDGDVVNEKGHFVTLTPRQAGSHQDDEVIRRTFPCLRKLVLSSCRALTDRACISLAHAVPSLEVLEMANVGSGLKDAGLVKLFATTPKLQKLDLERATHVTDAVLSALTPPETHAEAFGLAVPDRETLMQGTRPRGSLLHIARRSASRRRQVNQSTPTATAEEGSPPTYDQDAVAALIPATGTRLTHLILSSASRTTAEAMLLLINRCPFLIHLEVDDTHADNEVAVQFVQLARYRKVHNAYLSLIDCRSFTRDTFSQLSHSGGTVDGGVRPRSGSRGYAFRHFGYDDAEPSLAATAATHVLAAQSAEPRSVQVTEPAGSAVPESRERERGHDECNELKPVLKSFWGWQMVDTRIKQRRKAERAAVHRRHGGRSKVTSVVAMALGLPTAAGGGAEDARVRGSRWSRVLIGPEAGRSDDGRGMDDEDDDDARGCVVM